MKFWYLFLLPSIIFLYEARQGRAQTSAPQEEWPPGWTERCLGCICEATSDCNQTIGCLGDYCGIFLVSRTYWVDAGSPVLIGDDPKLPEAFTRCVLDPYCASRAVNQYILKHIQDCNNDGTLSCDDYARLHYLGHAQCTRNLRDNAYYRVFQKCFLRNPTPSPS